MIADPAGTFIRCSAADFVIQGVHFIMSVGRQLYLTTSLHPTRHIMTIALYIWETAVAQWLRYCATNRKVAGSIPIGVIGIFDIKSFRSHYGPGINSASNRNEYQEYFLGVKAAGA